MSWITVIKLMLVEGIMSANLNPSSISNRFNLFPELGKPIVHAQSYWPYKRSRFLP